jgi:MarR family 2-MHQ and catechol resistance regulon transcriptional repressor
MRGPAERFPELFDKRTTRALFALRTLAQRIDDDYNSWLVRYELTATKLNYLSVLYSVDGHSLAMGEISRFIHSSNANVTVMVNALERDGLVKRVRNPKDGRRFAARLTPKGIKAIEKTLPEHMRNLRRAMGHVTGDDVDVLMKVLLKIAAGFDEVMDPELASPHTPRSNGTRPRLRTESIRVSKTKGDPEHGD